MRNLGFLKHFINYFPIRLVKLCDLDPSKNYIIGSHHHGLACFGAHSAFCTDFLKVGDLFPGIKFSLLTLTIFHRLPLLRELMIGGGESLVSTYKLFFTNEQKVVNISIRFTNKSRQPELFY